MKKTYIKISGILNLVTALIHLVGGQLDPVTPLLDSDLVTQQKGELTGVWHIVTILLFFTSYLIIQAGFGDINKQKSLQLKPIGIFYILSGIPFIGVSIWFKILAPQWILLIPIGILLLLGLRKLE